METEHKEIDGVVYKRNVRYCPFWQFDPSPPEGMGIHVEVERGCFRRQTDAGKPHLLCPCGSVQFTIRYGDYEVFATCGKCGLTSSIYSG